MYCWACSEVCACSIRCQVACTIAQACLHYHTAQPASYQLAHRTASPRLWLLHAQPACQWLPKIWQTHDALPHSPQLWMLGNAASLPTSKLIFSRVCLITHRNGVPHLLVRLGNTRGNFLLNPEVQPRIACCHSGAVQVLSSVSSLPFSCSSAIWGLRSPTFPDVHLRICTSYWPCLRACD